MTQSRTQLALQVARAYYERNAKMERIASELGISRSAVSRLLKYARERGIVQIAIDPKGNGSEDVAELYWGRWDVHVHLVRMARGSSESERFDATIRVAAGLLPQLVRSDMTIALSWGTTIYHLSLSAPELDVDNCLVVQVNGLGNPRSSGVHYHSRNLERFANAFNARSMQLPAPLFFDDPRAKALLWREASIQQVLKAQRNADLAIFSIGHVIDGVPGASYLVGYDLHGPDLNALVGEDVVADVCSTFIRSDGSHEGIALNTRSAGADLNSFRSIRNRVAVVSGDHKSVATAAAIRGGFVTTLIVDEITAQAIARELREDSP